MAVPGWLCIYNGIVNETDPLTLHYQPSQPVPPVLQGGGCRPDSCMFCRRRGGLRKKNKKGALREVNQLCSVYFLT